MKKVILLSLALMLAISLFAGCGGSPAAPASPAPAQSPQAAPEPALAPAPEPDEDDDPADDVAAPTEDEFVDEQHFSFVAVGDWNYTPDGSWMLKNEEVHHPAAYMDIKWRIADPEGVIDVINHAFASCEQVDDVTIAGITYNVFDDSERFIFLVAPHKERGSIEIHIRFTDIEGAMPVLETIELK